MGTLADSLFNVLMGWVRALVNGIWALFTTVTRPCWNFWAKTGS